MPRRGAGRSFRAGAHCATRGASVAQAQNGRLKEGGRSKMRLDSLRTGLAVPLPRRIARRSFPAP